MKGQSFYSCIMNMELLFTFTCLCPQSLKVFFPLLFLKVLTKSQTPTFATSYKIFLNCHSKPLFVNRDTCNHQTPLACFCAEARVRGNRPQPSNLLPEYKNNDGWSASILKHRTTSFPPTC